MAQIQGEYVRNTIWEQLRWKYTQTQIWSKFHEPTNLDNFDCNICVWKRDGIGTKIPHLIAPDLPATVTGKKKHPACWKQRKST